MHIKQAIIEGFMGFKDPVVFENFSPKVNCVVGPNGLGKSDFFHAICFVLSALFQNVSSEDMHSLLYEGTGNQVLSALVEIVLDNSDGWIPVDKQEVRLRRTFGLTEGEYFLDGKPIKKTEVMNLLEFAGFSCSNSYNVIKQGQITLLIEMKDSERLTLLKEIGGARVYEERKHESLKIMEETGKKRKQIFEALKYLDEWLLDEVKEDQRKYLELDKQRKSLKYILYNKELQDTQQKLAKVEEDLNKRTFAKHYDTVQKRKYVDEEHKNLAKKLQRLSKEKAVAVNHRQEAIQKEIQLELDFSDLKERMCRSIRSKNEAAKQLQMVDKEIHESRKELDNIKPSYDCLKTQHDRLMEQIMEWEEKLNILYRKQVRATQFSCKAARDQWVQQEIDKLLEILFANLSQEKELLDQMSHLTQQLREQDDSIASQKATLADLESSFNQSFELFITSKRERGKLQDERKSLRQQENKVYFEIDLLKSDILKEKENLDLETPDDILSGLNSIRKICREDKIDGVCGPLIELFECDSNFFAAVEVTAGNSLFHVVVDSNETATLISKQLSTYKHGQVTFIPLNTVSPEVMGPCPDNDRVMPLLKLLKFDQVYASAFQQVFGKTAVCRDLDVAIEVSRTEGLNCVTVDGDQVTKKGGMSGGFLDIRRSKLMCMHTIKHVTTEIKPKEDELSAIRQQLQEIDSKITRKIIEQNIFDADAAHHRLELEQFHHDIVNANKQKRFISSTLEKKENMLSSIRMQIQQLHAIIGRKQAEMGTDLVNHLTAEERSLLSRLNPQVKEMKEQLLKCKIELMEIETKKLELEMNLSLNLLRRQQELREVVSSVDYEVLYGETQLEEDFDEVKASKEKASENLKSVSASMDRQKRELKMTEAESISFQYLSRQYEVQLMNEAKELKPLMCNKNTLVARQEGYSKKITELGVLSSDAFEMYWQKSTIELKKMLHKCNEQLQQFSHLNKEDLDQYVHFKEQRGVLQKCQAVLDAGDQEIHELISALDRRYDESLERTFKEVAQNFQEVFQELVQGGQGYLVMMKNKDDDIGDCDLNEVMDTEGKVEKYIGVKVMVSFTEQEEMRCMSQLSVSQKNVVALALIFAIQQCDPAPFYLFGEIDAALEDPQYRSAVANMICRLADEANTQFITTTFRPDLVKVADKIYGVIHENFASHVSVVSKEVALQLIERDWSHHIRWKVGKVGGASRMWLCTSVFLVVYNPRNGGASRMWSIVFKDQNDS